MADHMMDCIAGYYRATHQLVLKLLDNLDEQQIMWGPNRTAPSGERAPMRKRRGAA